MMRFALATFALAACAIGASPSFAQTAPVSKATVISIQPLSAMFSVYSIEAEHAVSPVLTIGVGGSYWSDNGDTEDVRYASGDLKLRYYPDAHPFRGFSFGGQAGYTSVRDEQSSYFTPGVATVNTSTTSGPTIGVALDYNWLLGATRSFYVGLGLGAKKIFAKDDGVGDANLAYPTARISVGMAF